MLNVRKKCAKENYFYFFIFMFTKQELWLKLSQLGCIRTNEIITLKSGLQSDTYIDLRLLTQCPQTLLSLCLLMHQEAKMIFTTETCLIGIPMGAIHLATLLSQITNIPQVLIRKNPKTHGTKKIIESQVKLSHVILVEDVITTGSSVKEIVDLLLEHDPNIKIVGIVCAVNRSKLTHLQHVPIYSVFKKALSANL